MKKKGQSALEYLVTYGWAILAIVIIAAVLWYFGIFNPSKWTESRQCGGMSAFSCIDYTVNSSDGITLSLGNKVGRQVVVYCESGNVTLNLTAPATCDVTGSTSGATQLDFSLTYYDVSSGLEHEDSGFVTTG